MTVVYARLNQALAGCEETLSVSGDWYDACARVSNILTSMGRFDEASQWHSMAIEQDPNLVQFHAKAAFLFVIQEKWDEAIRWYRQLLELDPKYTEAHRRLAQIYSRLGQLEDEVFHWYEFLTQQPELGTPDGHHKLGQSFQEQGRLERAASCYERAIALDEHYWPAYTDLAALRSQQKRWNAASEVYQRVLAQDPDRVEVHYELGKVWLQQKNYDRAIAKFKEINKLAPKFSPAYQSLVKAFMALKDWDTVISTCRSTISFVDEFPWAYSNMGRALIQKGEELKAIACYQKVCQLHGWSHCQQNDYQFTEDTFSHQIPVWRKHLQPLHDREGIAALTIGSSQGMIPCWLLDNVLDHASDELFCVDQAFPRAFDHNINQSNALDKIVCLEGKPMSLIVDLPGDSFDLVVIQDRCKQADYIQKEIGLCWPLLKNEGVLIVKGYGWAHPSGPKQSPKAGVDRFLKTIQNEFDVLVQSHQLMIKKRAKF